MTLKSFIDNILQIKSNCEFSVSSWIRSEKHNREIGGNVKSLHLVGLAIDVLPDSDDDKNKIIYWCNRLGLKCLDEKTHLHIQVD